MRLAALCKSHGFDLSAVADLCGVDPSLLVNIDAGIQALPRVLAVQIASVLTESVANVQASALLNTDLNAPVMYAVVPTPYGTPITPARIAPTVVVPLPLPPPPVTGDFWIGVQSERLVGGPPKLVPFAQPVVELANINDVGGLVYAGNGFVTGELSDPALTPVWSSAQSDLPIVRHTIVRASASEVWVLLYPGVSFDDPYIVRCGNDGARIADYFPLAENTDAHAWVIAKDPASANVWGAGKDRAVFRITVGAAPMMAYFDDPALIGYDVAVTGMMFVNTGSQSGTEGRLYCAFGYQRPELSDRIGIFEYDPTPGAEAFVQITPNTIAAVGYPVAFCYAAFQDMFLMTYPADNGSGGANASYFRFDRNTLTRFAVTFTEITSRIPSIQTITGIDVIYNATTDNLWFVVVEDEFGTDVWRLLEVPKLGGTALRSIPLTWPVTGTPAVLRGLVQKDGKLYVSAGGFAIPGDVGTITTGICVVDMQSGMHESTYVMGQTGFPWTPPTGDNLDFVATRVFSIV